MQILFKKTNKQKKQQKKQQTTTTTTTKNNVESPSTEKSNTITLQPSRLSALTLQRDTGLRNTVLKEKSSEK